MGVVRPCYQKPEQGATTLKRKVTDLTTISQRTLTVLVRVVTLRYQHHTTHAWC